MREDHDRKRGGTEGERKKWRREVSQGEKVRGEGKEVAIRGQGKRSGEGRECGVRKRVNEVTRGSIAEDTGTEKVRGRGRGEGEKKNWREEGNEGKCVNKLPKREREKKENTQGAKTPYNK